MPAKANPTATRSGPNPITRRLKDEMSKQKTKHLATLKKYREEKVPNALINSTGTMIGGVTTGAVRGWVPEEWTVMETKIPTGIVYDVGAVLTGAVVAGGSAMMKSEYGIHIGAGMTTVGVAYLTERGTSYLAGKVYEWWQGNGAAATGPSLAAGGAGY